MRIVLITVTIFYRNHPATQFRNFNKNHENANEYTFLGCIREQHIKKIRFKKCNHVSHTHHMSHTHYVLNEQYQTQN